MKALITGSADLVGADSVKRPASGTHEAPAIHKPDKRRKAKYGGMGRLDRLKWLLTNTSMSRKQIAATMKITELSCRTYNAELFKRENVSTRAALMLREIQRLSAENFRALMYDPALLPPLLREVQRLSDENFRLREVIAAGPFIQTR